MREDGLDAEGYIEICGAAENISALFLPVLDGSIALLKSTFQKRLHSIYLYGSVATGQAIIKQSDLDILLVLVDPMSEQDRSRIDLIARGLSESYRTLVREVGIAAASFQEALVEKNLSGLGCFIKHLCICVAGEDLRPRFPKFRPCIEVARGFNGDYDAVIRAKLSALAKAERAEIAHPLIRQICRKTVRTAFSLVMPRLGYWTTDLKRSFDYFCRYYPQKRADMTQILNWAQQPPEDWAKLLPILKQQTEWLTVEWKQAIGE